MEADNRLFANEFLYKAIDDTQSTIRSIDGKAAFGIALLGAMIADSVRTDRLRAAWTAGPITIAALVAFALVSLFAAVLAFKTVFPMINPAENVSVPPSLKPPFFVHELARSSVSRFFFSGKKHATLKETHDSYLETINSASESQIRSVLVGEVLKLAFIRQMKIERLTAFSKTLVAAAFIYLLFVGMGSTSIAKKQTTDQNPNTTTYIQADEACGHVTVMPKKYVKSTRKTLVGKPASH